MTAWPDVVRPLVPGSDVLNRDVLNPDALDPRAALGGVGAGTWLRGRLRSNIIRLARVLLHSFTREDNTSRRQGAARLRTG